MENWVICRIFLKKRGSNATKNDEIGIISECKSVESKPIFYDFMAASKKIGTDLNLKPVSSSSGSSGITDDVCSNDEHEEDSSNFDNVSNLRNK